MRQRIDYLEAESAALADRLVKGQVNLAQEAENSINIAHELNKLRDINSDAHRKLEQAYETIRELSCSRQGGMLDAVIQVDDTTMIEHIHSLQQELIESHNRQAYHENTIRECKARISELEAANKRLREHEPFEGVTGLQEELISVKMREAESNLALKEMRQRLAELEQHWAVRGLFIIFYLNLLCQHLDYLVIKPYNNPNSRGMKVTLHLHIPAADLQYNSGADPFSFSYPELDTFLQDVAPSLQIKRKDVHNAVRVNSLHK
ncbi:unnamed protein product [Heligmosomoides polygyrus]|uniref:Uncharacterized protein n=1 Tax=Heligmosomoides polygyrus TaxID=6339 RepID=A0A3P8B7I5_HELPZ|nr:unnamed protein product [Heligmosomoides polygyrus]